MRHFAFAVAGALLATLVLSTAQTNADTIVDDRSSHPIEVYLPAAPPRVPIAQAHPARFVVRNLSFAYELPFVSSRGIVGVSDDGMKIVDPADGRILLHQSRWCRLYGIFADVALVLAMTDSGCAPPTGESRTEAVSLQTGATLWQTRRDPVALGNGIAITASEVIKGPLGSPKLYATDAQSGRILWQNLVPASDCMLVAGRIIRDVAQLRIQCEPSGGPGHIVYSLDSRRIVDSDGDPDSSVSYADGKILTWWGGVHRWLYQPARIKVYNADTAALVLDADLRPDPGILGHGYNLSASSVALSRTSVYAAIAGRTYVYDLSALRALRGPVRIDIPGQWLGASLGDRLFYGNDRALYALDVERGRATPSFVRGAEGPFTSMVAAGTLGYALTRDRRIVTVRMDELKTLGSTQTPDCYALLSVVRWYDRSVAICTSDDQHSTLAIGL